MWLSENPCSDLPHYRKFVIKCLPELSKLDNKNITYDERMEAQAFSPENSQGLGNSYPSPQNNNGGIQEDNKSYNRRRTYQDDIEDDYNPQLKLRKAQSNIEDYRPQSRQSDEFHMNKRPEPEYFQQNQKKPDSRNQYVDLNNNRDRVYQQEKEYSRASHGNNVDRNRKPQNQKMDPSKIKLKNENVVTAILSLIKDLGE